MKSGIIVRTGPRTGGAYTDTAVLARANVQRDGRISVAFKDSKSKGHGVEVEVSLTPEAILALLNVSVSAALATARTAPEPDLYAPLDEEDG